MKKMILMLVAAILSGIAMAQSGKYAKAMEEKLAQLEAANTTSALIDVSNAFQRIGDAEKTQWLPYYYAALALSHIGWTDQTIDKDANAEKIAAAVRSHWAVENSLHWVLDVAFHEDGSRKRAGNAAENFSIVCRIALNLLKNDTTKNRGIKGKRLDAGWDNNYLLKILKN